MSGDSYIGQAPGISDVALAALTARVAALEAARPTLGAPVAAAGVFVDFAIPAGAKQIIILCNSLSLNGAANIIAQLGRGGVIENAGYLDTCGRVTAAVSAENQPSGFPVSIARAAGSTSSGRIVLALLDPATNMWVMTSNLGNSDAAQINMAGGVKALAGVLDRVRLTSGNGVDIFDSGTLNIMVTG